MQKMETRDSSIGVFDSGVGGVGVLKELVQVLPQENFIYYGDSFNAPYGEKTPDQVFDLVNRVMKLLLDQKVKAIVIACNTATSVAVGRLRTMYPEIPIIGMEPALKSAISEDRLNRVLVMATPVTLHLDKYIHLQQQYEGRAKYIPVECPGLAKRIEEANLEGQDLYDMLEGFLKPYRGQVDNVVLGCTHYPFIKKQIRDILGEIPIYDGGKGTARQVRRVLEAKGLLREGSDGGRIVFESSKNTEEELEIYKRLYEIYEV